MKVAFRCDAVETEDEAGRLITLGDAHAAHIGHPIIGDPKYFNIQNWELPGGIQNKLHLLARRIVLPHPRGKGTIDVSAPLPPHMRQSWNLLGFDDAPYDPIVEAPDE